MYIYNCIYIHITNRWYDMYTANRGYAMDTCIMCIYTICTVYTRLCTYIQYIYNFMSLYIYTRLHTLQYNYIWVAFLFQCKSASRAVLHMGNLPAASGCIAKQSTFFPLGPTLFPRFFPRLTSHREVRSKTWSAKTNFFFTCNKVKISTGKSEDCAKNICSSTCTNPGFTGKTWRGPLQTRGYQKHSQDFHKDTAGTLTDKKQFPSLNHGFWCWTNSGGIELQ